MIISNRVYFWDGDNFVIVNKKCDKETARKIMQALAQVDLDDGTEAAVAAVEPIMEPEEVMPPIPTSTEEAPVMQTDRFPGGRYKGMTPEEVLEKEGDKGYGNLAYLLKTGKYSVLEQEMQDAMDAYFQTRFGDKKADPFGAAGDLTLEDAKAFFTYFSSVLPDEKKAKVAAQAGMLDFDTLVKQGTEAQLRSLVASVWQAYLK